jgi:hypothetical protein
LPFTNLVVALMKKLLVILSAYSSGIFILSWISCSYLVIFFLIYFVLACISWVSWLFLINLVVAFINWLPWDCDWVRLIISLGNMVRFIKTQ